MILTGPEIIRQVSLGGITIEPFDTQSINPNSYNYHLGSELIEFAPGEIDPEHPRYQRIVIPPEGYVLHPGIFYLGGTLEIIGGKNFVTSLIGRSTLGRLGLWLQVTADLGHIGTNHIWTLELKVVQPLRIYAGMPIGQVTFWRVSGNIEDRYRGLYGTDQTPSLSKLKFHDFNWPRD